MASFIVRNGAPKLKREIAQEGNEQNETSKKIEEAIDQARRSGKLELTDCSLDEVPEAAFELKELMKLVWLFGNRIAILPAAVQNWKNIQQLRINGNLLVELPAEIGKLRALTMLIVSDNRLTSLPATINGCKMLQVLDCRSNCIKRLPVQIGALSNMHEFLYENNPLEFPHRMVLKGGKVAIFKYLKKYFEAKRSGKLDLTKCSLQEIPQEIEFVAEHLVELDISDIQCGSVGVNIPVSLCRCQNLKSLHINPEQTINFPPAVVYQRGVSEVIQFLRQYEDANKNGKLTLNGVGLSEVPNKTFDERFVNVLLLKELSIDHNDVSNLPPAIAVLENLTVLDVSFNKMDSIPVSVGKLKNLTFLDVSGNFLKEISDVLGRLPELKVIRARQNSLSIVSDDLRGISSVETFDGGKNKFAHFPFCVLTWPNLRSLTLDENEIVDIPPEIENLEHLECIDFSANLITSIPYNLAKLFSLNTLALNNNKFRALPDDIGNLSNLERLELYNCSELFSIPDTLAQISRFKCPLLHGEPHINKLILDTRYLMSPPPSAVEQGTGEIFEYLLFLKLSRQSKQFYYCGRNLSEIPFTVCMVDKLSELCLSNNVLTEDSFPSQFTLLANLKLLDLNNNHLRNFPTIALGLSRMATLSLANNPLVTFPSEMYLLVGLQDLDIGSPGPDLIFPPKEVSKRGGRAVIDFLRSFAMVLVDGRLELPRLSLKCIPSEFTSLSSRILRLSLAHNRLTFLPPTVKGLYNLSVLRVHDNMLDALPDEFIALTDLKELDLEGNRFDSCPPILSSLTSLTMLNLARNDMVECPLPICSLAMLLELYLDHNKINALPNRIGRCAHLVHLSVSHNELTKLPASVRDLTCLTSVNLTHNKLTIVPADIGLIKTLEILQLDGNELESPPQQIIDKGTWAVARYLEKIQEMFVTGQVNLSFCSLTTIPLDVLSYDAVNVLILTNNNIQEMPEGIGRLRHLKSLDLSNNSISALPPTIGQCIALEELSICRNPLTLLPWELGKLTNLRTLELDYESMESPPEVVARRGAKEVVRYLSALTLGETQLMAPMSGFDLKDVPQEILRMVSLKELRLDKNSLSSIPATIAKHTQLALLHLDDNPKIRDLPKTMRSMTTLTEISLAKNGLKSIPDEVFRLTNLTKLCFARNQLDGLGGLIGKLCYMQILDLSFNQLWTLPWPAILNMNNLHTLNLQGNPITYVSATIAQVTTLTSINLGDTKLPSLPADIVDLINLKILNLDNVNIQGPSIPIVAKGIDAIRSFLLSIRKARYNMELEFFELECEGGSSTGFSPYQLSSVLQHLKVCRSDLQFIPPDILELSLLTSLDLSQNQLKQLPNAFGNSFPFLEKFLANDNRISSIPKSIGLLTSLKELFLSKNALETLPAAIAECTALIHLDLTDNQITYLAKECRALTNVTNLEMVFRCLTDFQNLNLSWNMWGKPPADITLQGGKIVRKFYTELLRVSGTSEALLDRLQGPQSTLNLSKFGLVRTPQQLFEKNLFSHLVTLDLSFNKIESLSPEISRLSKLQLINLTECPIKNLTPSIGALSTDILVETSKIANIPEIWLQKGKDGVLEYTKKAFLEIDSGCLDFTGSGLRSLPYDLSDFFTITELFLANNGFSRLPASVGLLTNLTSLRVQQNVLCCIPREISHLSHLKCLSVQGNRINILPTELGLLTGITDLGYDAQTFTSLPNEVCHSGSERVLQFLAKLEQGRGQQKLARAPPGLVAGQKFDLYVKDQLFNIVVPRGYDSKKREGFVIYLPDVPQDRRNALVADGVEFMKDTSVGLTLDVGNLGLRDLQLMAVPGTALNISQEAILKRSMELNLQDPDEQKKKGVKSVLVSNAVEYETSNDGIISIKKARPEPRVGTLFPSIVGAKNGITAVITEQVKRVADIRAEEEIATDLPTLRYDTDDLILVWMVDHALQSVYPLPIGPASSLTELRLDGNKISTLPSSIGTLSNLTILSASRNHIEAVTWRLRYLIHLREIDLSVNRISELPPKIGRCDRLKAMKLSVNSIRHLPVSIGRLTSLCLLEVDQNPIQCLPHEIGGVDDEENRDIKGLISVETISLKDCEALRHLPSKLFRLTQLQNLDLSGSTGLVTPPPEVYEEGIPSTFRFLEQVYAAEQTMSMMLTMHNLRYVPVLLAELSAHVNEKQGKYIGMPNLKLLDLSHNNISKMPPFMSILSNLRSLVLDYNHIRRISPVVAKFTRLVSLSIQHNDITQFCNECSELLSIRSIQADFNAIDSLCDGFVRLSTLQELSLENNCLRIIPDVILKLSELKILRLSCNKIAKVPDGIVGMCGLQQFILRDNELRSLPDAIGLMSDLQELDIADNQIEMLPLGLGKLTALTKLETRRNGIIRPSKGTQAKGPRAVIEYLQRVERAVDAKLLDLEGFGLTSFPLDVVSMDSLTGLNISANEITAIPEDIMVLTRIVTLRIAMNRMQTLPLSVCRLSTLQTLDVHDNRLQALPTSFKQLTTILHLDIAKNAFEVFPPVLEGLTQIEHLNVNDNLLTRMPYWIGTFSKARSILFGGNQLCTMPNSIGALGPVVLQTLNLSNNGLIKIPAAICTVATLRTLTFSGNALDELPSALGKLAALEELWIDNNKISRLPTTFPFWAELTTLYAHNNCFKTIPAKLIELQKLRVLTLSGNMIEVLPDMSLLTNLEELWLDGNRLAAIPYFEKLPSLRFFSCRDNPLIDSHAARAGALMGKYKDPEVERRLAEMAAAAVKTNAANSGDADADGPVVVRELTEDERAEAEAKVLSERLAAAWAADDLELVSELQERLDALAGKAEAERDDERPSSAVHDMLLTVTVVSCKGLSFGKQKDRQINAYVVLDVDGEQHKTKVQSKTASPVFNEAVEFALRGKRESELALRVQVMHKNTFTKDAALASTLVDHQIIRIGRETEGDFALRSDTETGLDAGVVRLRIKLEATAF